jgi:hypothetical protein
MNIGDHRRRLILLLEVALIVAPLELAPLDHLEAAVVGVTVGTSAGQVLAAPAPRGYRLVIIRNQSGAATISCAPGNSSPAIGSAGSFDIAPGTSQTWTAANVVFDAAWYCIASVTNTPVTIEAE